MKKRFGLLAIVLAFLCVVGLILLPMEAKAEDTASGTCGDNLTWVLDNSGTLTIDGTGNMYNWDLLKKDEIPWYSYRSSIINVIIQHGVTSIGQTAFCNLSNLKDISIPDSVTSINTWAFWGCSSLVDIRIPANVSYMGNCIFIECSSLQNFMVSPDNSAFSSPDGILCDKAATTLIAWPSGRSDVSIPDTITIIGSAAFYDCSAITSVIIPQNITDIGKMAFYYCDQLREIVLPDNLKTIGASAFSACFNLQKIIIPSGVSRIEPFVFSNCESLVSILIQSDVTSIGEWAFFGCDSLRHVLYTGTQAMWNNIETGDIQLSEDAIITYSYTEGMNYHTYDDNKDSRCNVCDQFRIVGCVEDAIGIEIKTYADYPYTLTGTGAEYVTMNYIGQSSMVIGSNGIYCKGYELVFSQPGCYELIFVQDVTGSTLSFNAEITEHNWAFNSTVAPTCNSNGYDLYVCSHCNAQEKRNVTNATEHTWDNGKVTKEATCKEEGVKAYTCIHCGDSYKEEIPALDHSFVGGACTNCGEIDPNALTPGDVNGDGAINTRDAKLIMQYELGLIDETKLDVVAADVNGDGAVNTRDAKLIMQLELGLIPGFSTAQRKYSPPRLRIVAFR